MNAAITALIGALAGAGSVAAAGHYMQPPPTVFPATPNYTPEFDQMHADMTFLANQLITIGNQQTNLLQKVADANATIAASVQRAEAARLAAAASDQNVRNQFKSMANELQARTRP